jgi:BASS family bile acid:Na+ symporter
MSLTSRGLGLLNNNRFIFALALVLGLVVAGGAEYLEPSLVPLLGLIMTLSILEISAKTFLELRKIIRPTILALVLNYIVLSGVIIGMSALILDDADLHTGYVLVAAVPPAVAVIPFTFQLGGNTRFSLVGDVAAYIAALAITPAISLLFLGTSFIETERLLIVLGELIIGPIILSRIVRRTPLMSSVEKWRGPVVNWSFFLVFYTIVGLNSEAFLGEPGELLRIAAVAFVSTFVLAWAIERVSRIAGVDRADRISLMLLGTRKTYGVAGAIALIFFDARAAIPAAVASAVSIIHFVWLTWRVRTMS